jgi:hypothetical protein
MATTIAETWQMREIARIHSTAPYFFILQQIHVGARLQVLERIGRKLVTRIEHR